MYFYVFLGTNAGFSNINGNNNAFVGAFAGMNTTSGINNTFLGGYAGYNNMVGGYNSFVGYRAGYNNTSGYGNSFMGYHTGEKNTTGNDNSFFGRAAGNRNTSGSKNAFIGSYAGNDNLTGEYNAFVGSYAGFNNISGNHNTFVGSFAGQKNIAGSGNAFMGSEAGRNTTSGINNAFIGTIAGRSNTSGSGNAFVGHSAGFNNTEGFGAFMGFNAGGSNTTGGNNAFIGYNAGLFNSTGKSNTFIGMYAGFYNATGSDNAYFGYDAGSSSSLPNLNNATALGNRALVSRSNSLVLGSIKGKHGATSDVNVGIGVDAPTYQLHLSKNAAAKPGSSTWTVASDERLKTEVEAFTDGLNVLLQVKPVKYHYNGKAQMPTEKEYVGVIAQEMKEVAPYMVGEFIYQDTTGKEEKYLDYDASALSYILVNAVKEHQQTIQAMQEENGQLKQELAQIKQLLSRLPVFPAEGNGGVARLWQNTPNPYERTTVIRYFVPQSAGSAAIVLFNSSGQQVSNYTLSTGDGEIILSSAELAAGTYVYKLIVDGISVDSKKLVLVK